MSVAAVCRGDHVGGPELGADADGGRLLSGVEMDEAGNLAASEFVVDAILETPDRSHAAIAVEEKLPTVLHVASQTILFSTRRVASQRGHAGAARPEF